MKRQIISLTIFVLLTSCGEKSPNRHIENGKDIDAIDSGIAYIYINSGIHHSKLALGSATLTYRGEKNAKGAIVSPFRKIPKITDTDLLGSPNDRPTKDCGTNSAHNTLLLKVEDCDAQNTTEAKKVGHQFGNSGEGNWFLVVRTSTGKEVWYDQRTQMLWSDNLGKADNWCKASGNTENVSGVIDCDSDNSLSDDLCGDNTTAYKEAKGNLEALVTWRLPTRSDWLTADINGLKFAISDSDTDYWSATGSQRDLAKAWIYNAHTGLSMIDSRSKNDYSVRCIGTFK